MKKRPLTIDHRPLTKRGKEFLFSLLVVYSLWSIVYGQSLSPQTLNTGESVTLKTDYPIGDISLTDPEVVDFMVAPDRGQIDLHARSEGFTTLNLFDAEGNPRDSVPITVYGVSIQGLMRSAKKKFGAHSTIQFLVEDQTLRIVGDAPSPSIYQKLEAFAGEHPEVSNEVTIAQPVLRTITDRIEQAIGIPGIKVRSIRNQIVLEGVAYSEAQAQKAYAIAKLYNPNCLNLIEVRASDRAPGREKMVQLDVYFMEIQKSALRSFGIQWTPGAFPANAAADALGGGGDGSAGIGGLGQSLIGFVLNLLPKIRLIRERGLGRVLENPTLFVKSGDLADFFSGVQVPYFAQDSVQFKEVGVKLNAQPIVYGSDIDLKLTAVLSSPSPHIQGGINTHSVSTTAYIPSGQAVVLGGIVSNRDVKTYHRVPRDLATSSALFTLFLSKDFQSSKSELVVFVLPKIVDQPASAASSQEDWTQLEEKIVRDRSLKEYLEYMKEHGKPAKKRRHRRL